MQVIVIGGGVIGVTTAYYLRQAGADVVVIEKQSGAAQETSLANAGTMTASRAGPWASPKSIAKTLKGYRSSDSAFRLRLGTDIDQYIWLAGFCVAAFNGKRTAKRKAMMELGVHSLSERRKIDEEWQLDYGGTRKGLLTIFDSQDDFESAVEDLKFLHQMGISAEALSPAECLDRINTNSRTTDKLAGGILADQDESGDCFRFTKALVDLTRELGVEYRFNESVRSIKSSRPGNCEVLTNNGSVRGDAIVIATGIQSLELAKDIGVRLPIYPVKGYSISVPLPAEERPNLTVADEHRKVFITPTETGIRAAGVADIVGYSTALSPERLDVVKGAIRNLFPSAQLDGNVEAWAGLRAMTHDGPPVICGLSDSGVWLNSGHGSLGWTFACGAGETLSKMVLSGDRAPPSPFFGLDHRWMK